MSGERKKTENGRQGIWRASIPATPIPVLFPSPKRRSGPRLARFRDRRWKPPAPIPALFLAILLFVQASALPVHVGLLLLPPHAAAMTHGCQKGTCCTPLCYLDKHGVHHCVHMPGDSCNCSMTTTDVDSNPIFLSDVLVLTEIENLLPELISAGRILPTPVLIRGHVPAVPSPPPK